MLKQVGLAGALSIGVLISSTSAFASQISMEEKVSLQASMHQHIDAMTIDGIIPHVSLADGTIADLVPTKAHPMILTFGDKYVLCTDFRDKDGKFVNVDFYLTKNGEKYVVFQTEINNRDPLEKLMKSGKVAMID